MGSYYDNNYLQRLNISAKSVFSPFAQVGNPVSVVKPVVQAEVPVEVPVGNPPETVPRLSRTEKIIRFLPALGIVGGITGSLGSIIGGGLGYLGARRISGDVRDVPVTLKRLTDTLESKFNQPPASSAEEQMILQQMADSEMLEAERAEQQQQALERSLQAVLELQRSQPPAQPQPQPQAPLMQYIPQAATSQPFPLVRRRRKKRPRGARRKRVKEF